MPTPRLRTSFALLNRKMCAQKSISSFFKPVQKREAASVGSAAKKQKLDAAKDEQNSDCKWPNENVTPNKTDDTASSEPEDKIQAEIDEMSRLFPIVSKSIGHSWFKFLKEEFNKPYFQKLNKFVLDERKKGTVHPEEDKLWSWTEACPVNKVRVVILGQDPYHNPRQAHGLCFSVQPGVAPPPSLLNMYKELETDIEGFTRPNHGYLIGWARQGVLLLNAVLTVRQGSPNSHKDQGWEQLTTAVIKHLNQYNRGVVFLLWGAYAQNKASIVDNKKHHVLKTVHPSPLSASRGFFGCKHFSKCNEFLEKQGKTPIDWECLPIK